MIAERIFEVEWLMWHLFKKGIYHKICKNMVDVGAGDGKHQSNSLAFIEMGWNALLIDGLETNIEKCKRLHRARPFVKCIQAVVSDKEEAVNFELDDRFWALSGISYEKEPNVQAVTLSSILTANRVKKIGVMSLDIENMEHLVLNDLVSNNIYPQILIVEGNELAQMHAHREILKGNYRVVGGVFPNQIFVRKDLKW